MSMFESFWKNRSKTQAQKPDEPLSPTLKKQIDAAKSSIDRYQSSHFFGRTQTLNKLKSLKQLVSQPKEDKPEARSLVIKETLDEPVCHHTVREERWQRGVYCPECRSTKILRLPVDTQRNPHNFHYQCESCGAEFNDDSDTPFESGFPPLHIWMQCWYLIGCTTSMSYIAAKLDLDIAMIEQMVIQLQRLFNATQPLTNMESYEKWEKEFLAKHQPEIEKLEEILHGESTHQPKDTAEYRRQKNRRTAPPKQSI